MYRGVQLFQLIFHLGEDGAVANVGVDLAAQGDTDAHGLKRISQVMDVGRDDHAASGHFGTDQFGFYILAFGHIFHGRSDITGAGGLELRRHGRSTSGMRSQKPPPRRTPRGRAPCAGMIRIRCEGCALSRRNPADTPGDIITLV